MKNRIFKKIVQCKYDFKCDGRGRNVCISKSFCLCIYRERDGNYLRCLISFQVGWVGGWIRERRSIRRRWLLHDTVTQRLFERRSPRKTSREKQHGPLCNVIAQILRQSLEKKNNNNSIPTLSTINKKDLCFIGIFFAK